MDGLLVAPARYFGPITGTTSISAGDVMTVTAACRWQGELRRRPGFDSGWALGLFIAVVSEAEASGCGRIGRSVEILIGDKVVGRRITLGAMT